MPDWIPTRVFRTHPRTGGSRLVRFPLVNDDLALLWMVQMHCIDMNAWYSRIDRPERPDFVLFDLDPPDGGFGLAVRVARTDPRASRRARPGRLREDERRGWHPRARANHAPLELRGDVRLCRGRGRRGRAPPSRPGDDRVAEGEARGRPRRPSPECAREDDRLGLFRASEARRPRSTPLRWEELTERLDPKTFTMAAVLARVERHGDLFSPVLTEPQALAPAQRALDRIARSI